ncbi:MAG: two-component sensor histidine kinase [Planctomycetaceae bacterium]|nr:two-component sensor histidine kinase [Planctomycetaceae bacterium]MCB9952413.1 two-component sensor histidine kinase [Planctomycetaceae bacterium]
MPPSEEPTNVSPPKTESPTLGDAERQQLRERYAEIASLAGGLAHEVRNPLSTIRMNLGLLFEDLDESEFPAAHRMRRKLDRIQKECFHLEETLEAFLNFARAGELMLEPTDLNGMVTEFIEFYRPEAKQLGIDVSPHLASNLPLVNLDQRLMKQVLNNLVRNAQQAMPDGGLLELQTSVQDGQVVLEIIDTGCGMSDAVRGKLFDVFFSTKPGGSGLGLPTVRKIVESHGGTIRCDSDLGKGTRFVIALPTAKS